MWHEIDECGCDCHGQFKVPHEECTPWCRHEGVPECVCVIPGNLEDESMIDAARKCYAARVTLRPLSMAANSQV